MVTIIGVRFRNAGKIYYFDPGDKKIPRGTSVIVETARGFEMGTVIVPNKEVEDESVVQPLKPVIRIANEDDFNIIKENKLKQKEAYFICKEKIRKHDLQMKLVDVEYTFDNNKILFYFTADGRIDFRELVKDLASVFKTRIELRQIGVRDETKMLGGVGICGRGLCCATYLSDFVPVSIRMAKEQNLSLNPTKISGVCGRLMCCLKNEEDTYEYLNSRLPSVGEKVVIKGDNITGEVQSVNVLRQKVKVLIRKDDDDTEMREVLVDDLKLPGKKKCCHCAGEEGNGGWNEAVPAEEEVSAEELAMLEDQPELIEENENRRGRRENPRKDRGDRRNRENREGREPREARPENGEEREGRPERGDRNERRDRRTRENREYREPREARPENSEGREARSENGEAREARAERGERSERRDRRNRDNRENRELREGRPENNEGREAGEGRPENGEGREARPERGERPERRDRRNRDNRENREFREGRPEKGEGGENREGRPERGERNERRDRRNRDNRENREFREGRPEKIEGGENREGRPERGERPERRDRRNRDNREPREARPENFEGREPRAERPERSERNPRNGEEGGREEHRGRRNDRRRGERRNNRRENENE